MIPDTVTLMQARLNILSLLKLTETQLLQPWGKEDTARMAHLLGKFSMICAVIEILAEILIPEQRETAKQLIESALASNPDLGAVARPAIAALER